MHNSIIYRIDNRSMRGIFVIVCDEGMFCWVSETGGLINSATFGNILFNTVYTV